MTEGTELEKLRKYMKLKKLAVKLPDSSTGALVRHEKNLYYLTGFANSEGTLLITRDCSYLLVDFRYGEAAQKQVTNCQVVVYKKYNDAVKAIVKKHGLNKILIESAYTTIKAAKDLKKNLAEINCNVISDVTLDKYTSNLRIIKTKDELAKIERAQRITEEAYLELLNMVKPGVKELDLALELEFLMRRKGASGVSFDLITIAGKKTSMPHGVPGNETIQYGDFVTFDIGAVYEGYHSDMTRTIAVGEVSDRQKEIYNVVLEAQQKGLSKVKAGIKAKEIDRAAREVIENAGYGENFRHSTGHGVGLDIHELPYVSEKSDILLSEGMVITVEPGIYLPNEFGVRIEDMVAVTRDGCYNFAKLSKDLLIL